MVRLDGQPIDDSLPRQLVDVAAWEDWIEEDEEDIRVIDFGQASMHGQEPERLAQPEGLIVPESILTNTFDYRMDLWHIGIVVRAIHFCKTR